MIARLLIICVSGLFFLSSCRILYKKRVGLVDLKSHSSGVFSGFVVLQQKKKRYYLTAELAVSPKGLLKIDFMVALGFPVMSLLIHPSSNEDGIVVFFQSKSFYRGKKLRSVINQKFSLPLDMGILREVLFEKPPTNKGWHCQKNDANQWSRCVHKGYLIEWQKEKRQKILLFSAHDWKFSFHYSKFISKTHPNQFILKPPSDFKLIAVP